MPQQPAQVQRLQIVCQNRGPTSFLAFLVCRLCCALGLGLLICYSKVTYIDFFIFNF